MYRTTVTALCLLLMISLAAPSAWSSPGSRLHLVVVGSEEVGAFYRTVVAPAFERQHPTLKLEVTVASAAAAQEVLAGTEGVDVALLPPDTLADWRDGDLLAPYVRELTNWVEVFLMPANERVRGRQTQWLAVAAHRSQLVLAYRPDLFTAMPTNMGEIVTWIKENPGRFGYSNPEERAAGLGWLTAWLYWKGADYRQLNGPAFDAAAPPLWEAAVREWKSLPTVQVASDQEALAKLVNGEVWLAPVWADQFRTWESQQATDSPLRVAQVGYFMPGETMYYAIPHGAANRDAAKRLVEFMTAPATQASLVMTEGGYLPGIQMERALGWMTTSARERLPGQYGKVVTDDRREMPTAPYLAAIRKLYQEQEAAGTERLAASAAPGQLHFLLDDRLVSRRAGQEDRVTLLPAGFEPLSVDPSGEALVGMDRSGGKDRLALLPLGGGALQYLPPKGERWDGSGETGEGQTLLTQESLLTAIPTLTPYFAENEIYGTHVAWAPDGARLATWFKAYGNDPWFGVVVMEADGSAPRIWRLPVHLESIYDEGGVRHSPHRPCQFQGVKWLAGGEQLLVGLTGPGCEGRLTVLETASMRPVAEWTVPDYDTILTLPEERWVAVQKADGTALLLAPGLGEGPLAAPGKLFGWTH